MAGRADPFRNFEVVIGYQYRNIEVIRILCESYCIKMHFTANAPSRRVPQS
jgi:hypothetical protein